MCLFGNVGNVEKMNRSIKKIDEMFHKTDQQPSNGVSRPLRGDMSRTIHVHSCILFHHATAVTSRRETFSSPIPPPPWDKELGRCRSH